VLAAQQTYEAAGWYQGTADAVRQQIRYVIEDPCQEVLILSGDQLYRMDFRQLLTTHRQAEADVTIAVLPVLRSQVEGFGIVGVDPSGRVVGFVEKPKTEEQLEPVRMSEEWLAEHGVHGTGRPYLASMGIYVFKRQALLDLLNDKPLAIDFGKEVFPRSIRSHHVQAHVFDGYWEDLGTVKAYHDTSLALVGDNPPFDFHSPEGVIYTRMRFLPASRISAASVKDCLISDGCIVQEGTTLERCMIGVRSRIGRNVTIRDTVLIGADRFETDQERWENQQRGVPDLGIGENSVIEKAIIDKDCRIGRNVRITNSRGLEDAETDQWVIREGIVTIPRGTVIPDGTVI
jgi:glucose-1-phosphate adenylyltransferase